MKKSGHPAYQKVLFVDTATGSKRLIGTILKPEEKEKFEGQEYPVYKIAISSNSHPFYTGSSSLVDSEGRVDKFNKRYAKKEVPAKAEAPVVPAKKTAKKKG